MVKWRIYFFIMCLVYIVSLFVFFNQPKAQNIFDISANSLSIIALFGFCYNKKIFIHVFWKWTFILCIVTELSNGILGLKEINSTSQLIPYLVLGFVLVLPIYFAFFIYAFKMQKLWSVK